MKREVMFSIIFHMVCMSSESIYAQQTKEPSPLPPEPNLFKVAIHRQVNKKAVGPKPFVIRIGKTWAKRDKTLKICFVNGTNEERQYIAKTALEWTKHGDLKLDFYQVVPGQRPLPRGCGKPSAETSEIRVAITSANAKFYPDDTVSTPGIAGWSELGTDALNRNAKSITDNVIYPTIFFYENTPKPHHVLHEFGHALGLEHEHQSPAGKCDAEFNWSKVYDLYKGTFSPQEVDLFIRPFPASLKTHLVDVYDTHSVMHYQFPKDMFIKGDKSPCYVAANTELSDYDKAAMHLMYPKFRTDVDAEEVARLNKLRTSNDVRSAPPVVNVIDERLKYINDDINYQQLRNRAFLLGYESAMALGLCLQKDKLMEQSVATVRALLSDLGLDKQGLNIVYPPCDPADKDEAVAKYARQLTGTLQTKGSEVESAFLLGWLGILTSHGFKKTGTIAKFSIKEYAEKAGFSPCENACEDEHYLLSIASKARNSLRPLK